MRFLLLLAAATVVRGDWFNVTSCGYGRYRCEGVYRPHGESRLSGKPLYVRDGDNAGPGIYYLDGAAPMWALSMPSLKLTQASTSAAVSQHPDLPPVEGWSPVGGFCCAPRIQYSDQTATLGTPPPVENITLDETPPPVPPRPPPQPPRPPRSPPPPPPFSPAPAGATRLDIKGRVSGLVNFDRALVSLQLKTLIARRMSIATNRVDISFAYAEDSGASFALRLSREWMDGEPDAFARAFAAATRGSVTAQSSASGEAVDVYVATLKEPWALGAAVLAACQQALHTECRASDVNVWTAFFAYITLDGDAWSIATAKRPATRQEVATAKLPPHAAVTFSPSHWLRRPG